MKILFFILSVMSSAVIHGQSYFPLVDSSKKWSEMTCGVDAWNISPANCETSFFKFSGDTVINNITYFKAYKSDTLEQSWEIQGFIRENAEKKVYFRNLLGLEGLLYDFGIGLNDTLEIDNTHLGGWPFPLICDKIDSIQIGNEYRKRYTLNDLENPKPFLIDRWIEGIGSEYGILESSGYVSGATYDLLCFYKNDTLAYVAPYNDCNISGDLGPAFTFEYLDTAYLNEYYEFQLELENTQSNSISYLLYENLPDSLILDSLTGVISGMPYGLFNNTIIVGVQNYCHTVDILVTNFVVINPLLVNERKTETKLMIYPNPAMSYIIVKLNRTNVTGTTLTLFDNSGKIVKTANIPTQTQDYVMGLKDVKPGIYILKADMDGKTIGSKKFSIVK